VDTAIDDLQSMPPRVRGGRSIDAPRAQAAHPSTAACAHGASIDRSARPMAGPASARNADLSVTSVSPCLRFWSLFR